jgi:hypothetical protein
MQESVVALSFTMADPAAAPAGAFLAPVGAPDVVDVAAVPVPYAGAIVGISVAGSPASGDTVTCVPQVCASATGTGAAPAGSLSTQITNAGPANSTIVTKDQADARFNAGQFIGVKYSTTTGGTYTARDVAVVLYVQTGLEDI